MDLVHALSALVAACQLTLQDLVALWLNVTEDDPCPNKALDPAWLDILLHDYPYRGAFRHIPLASRIVRHFAGSAADPYPTLVDLALPFGWTGSPAHYGAFGGAISYLVGRESPCSLTRYHPDALAETALKLAMLAVLGPNGINDKKFSAWEPSLCALARTDQLVSPSMNGKTYSGLACSLRTVRSTKCLRASSPKRQNPSSTNPIGLLIDHNDPLFSINVREALSVVFAAVTWGKYWQRFSQHAPVVIRCWLDNASAVSWFNRRYSANPAGQELVRVLSCAELVFNISFSMAYLPGATNVLADRGSRAWSGDAAYYWPHFVRD
ncbi:hypothetical protein ATCC90586_011527 [Pythium insidiosum]|nr:hypothetical protein ATCC90586_011527 [Pythium insidiosum]